MGRRDDDNQNGIITYTAEDVLRFLEANPDF